MLYEVAVIKRPTKKEMEEGAVEELVFGPKAVIAHDEKSAAISALIGPDRPSIDMARAEVLVRPFV